MMAKGVFACHLTYKNLLQKFKNNVPIILDSGVSKELERRGAPMLKGQWSALCGN